MLLKKTLMPTDAATLDTILLKILRDCDHRSSSKPEKETKCELAMIASLAALGAF